MKKSEREKTRRKELTANHAHKQGQQVKRVTADIAVNPPALTFATLVAARRLYMVSLVSQNVLIKKSDRDFVLSKLTWHVLYLIKIAPSILLHMVIACGTWAHTAGKHNTTAAS